MDKQFGVLSSRQQHASSFILLGMALLASGFESQMALLLQETRAGEAGASWATPTLLAAPSSFCSCTTNSSTRCVLRCSALLLGFSPPLPRSCLVFLAHGGSILSGPSEVMKQSFRLMEKVSVVEIKPKEQSLC